MSGMSNMFAMLAEDGADAGGGENLDPKPKLQGSSGKAAGSGSAPAGSKSASQKASGQGNPTSKGTVSW